MQRETILRLNKELVASYLMIELTPNQNSQCRLLKISHLKLHLLEIHMHHTRQSNHSIIEHEFINVMLMIFYLVI